MFFHWWLVDESGFLTCLSTWDYQDPWSGKPNEHQPFRDFPIPFDIVALPNAVVSGTIKKNKTIIEADLL